MIHNLSNEIIVTNSGDEVPSEDFLRDKRHSLKGEVDSDNKDIYLRFSSRLALYEFARSLLQEAVYGNSGQKDFYPILHNGEELVVDGVRMVEGSSRIFIFYDVAEG